MIRSTRGSDIMAACGQLAELPIDADESIDGGSMSTESGIDFP